MFFCVLRLLTEAGVGRRCYCLFFFFRTQKSGPSRHPNSFQSKPKQLHFSSKVSLSAFLYVTSSIHVSVVFQKLRLLLICHFHHIPVLSFISNTLPWVSPSLFQTRCVSSGKNTSQELPFKVSISKLKKGESTVKGVFKKRKKKKETHSYYNNT